MTQDAIPPADLYATLPYMVWENAFTPAELDTIERYGDALTLQKATIHDLAQSDDYAKIRVTRTAGLQKNTQTQWFYDRIERIIRNLNAASYEFDLRGFSEPFQYAVYQDAEGGHYDWHIDHGPTKMRRKLSLSVQISDSTQYEGCDLQFHASNQIHTAPRARGTVIAFPSYVLHRVTPVTAGVRKSVVVWTSGPKFK